MTATTRPSRTFFAVVVMFVLWSLFGWLLGTVAHPIVQLMADTTNGYLVPFAFVIGVAGVGTYGAMIVTQRFFAQANFKTVLWWVGGFVTVTYLLGLIRLEGFAEFILQTGIAAATIVGACIGRAVGSSDS